MVEVRAQRASKPVSGRLPDFPWDKLTQYAAQAREHADGIVDLSIGTPVDPTPQVARAALAEAVDAPGYPFTAGTPEVRQSVVDWLAGTHGVTGLDLDQVLPLIGSKEFIASRVDGSGGRMADAYRYFRSVFAEYLSGDDPAQRAREDLVHVLLNHNDFVTIR